MMSGSVSNRSGLVDIGQNLNTETVGRAGLLKPLCVEPGSSVRQVLAMLKAQNRGSVLICQGGMIVGIFTERDALRVLASGNLDTPIESAMTTNPVVLRPYDTIGSAIARMATDGYRRLPIVDGDGRPIGVLEVRGIIHWLVEHFPKAVYNLPPVGNPATQHREGP
jgi:CBS domain-containing protein